jgi:hypothetical protein
MLAVIKRGDRQSGVVAKPAFDKKYRGDRSLLATGI